VAGVDEARSGTGSDGEQSSRPQRERRKEIGSKLTPGSERRYRVLEHSNARFESIRFDSLCESIRIDSFCKKKSAFRFTSCHAVFLAYLLYSLSQKKLTLLIAAFNTSERRQKQLRNAYSKNYS